MFVSYFYVLLSGDLYFEKAVNGFLSDLFAKWKVCDFCIYLCCNFCLYKQNSVLFFWTVHIDQHFCKCASVSQLANFQLQSFGKMFLIFHVKTGEELQPRGDSCTFLTHILQCKKYG